MNADNWENMVVTPARVMEKIKPGMSIFIGTGAAEPKTLVKHLMCSDAVGLQDLELIQLVSFGDAVSAEKINVQKYRLKTFFSGWLASQAIDTGQVDLIPSLFYQIPKLIEDGHLSIDVAFIQITPPDSTGYCSLGVSVDIARQAMHSADLVVGEINHHIPVTFGDTFVHLADFDMLIQSNEPPLYIPRWPEDEIIDQTAANVVSIIEDGSCIAFTNGPLFECLGRRLAVRRNLGVHSPFFTDALMDLVKSGAVTNRNKEIFRGKSLASYASGSQELLAWLDRNPLVEFQSIDKVFNPIQIGVNPKYIAVLPARKVDLSGRVALQAGKGNVVGSPAEAMNLFHGAELSKGGRTIFALTSRNLKKQTNILICVEGFPNQFSQREAVDIVVTEYGVANLEGRTVRERAQAMIDIAHPDDRQGLVEKAKSANILYHDQIFLVQNAHLYPSEIAVQANFKNDLEIRFRPIKPSDEEGMRRLFYRFSDKAVYYRYFSPIKTMRHSKMQEYVNVDYSKSLSIVGLAGPAGQGQIIAEGRYIKNFHTENADVAFVVDEQYQGLGLATYLYKFLIRLAKERGIKGFTADVLATNKGMLKVFEKGGLAFTAKLDSAIYELDMPFSTS